MRSPTPHRHHRRTTLALAALVALSAGCGAASERVGEAALESLAEDGEEVDVDLDEDRMTARDEDGNEASFGAADGIPEQLAEAVEVPAGFQPQNTFEATEDGRAGVIVSGLLEGAEPLGFIDELEANAQAGGWTTVEREDAGGQLLLELERGEETLGAQVVDNGAGASVTLILGGPA
ncbi:MAG: hypothetical protein ACLFUG_11030 [Nitriliruptoraceae bacterium]